MTFMGYDENNKSIWFDSNGMSAHIDIHKIWEDLLPNNSGKGRDYAYVNRFDKDRYIKEVYGNQIKELEEKQELIQLDMIREVLLIVLQDMLKVHMVMIVYL